MTTFQQAVGFAVGSVQVDPPLLLAPMEDVTTKAFRVICKEIGNPGLMFTEFVSSMAAHHARHVAVKKMSVHPSERPLAVQIFGGSPEIMGEAAKLAEEEGADIIDINMGCWVPKVCRQGSGAALLKDPELANRIVRAVVDSTKLPVTVKVRAGWDYSAFTAPEIVSRFVDSGAKMITLHARFAKQGFEGQANWSLIAELRKAISVPLVGNGDVKTPMDSWRMLKETGCDGVMVGRQAIGNPWILRSIRAAMEGLPEPEPPSIEERISVCLRHLRLLIQFDLEVDSWEASVEHPNFPNVDNRQSRAFRGQAPLYFKGFRNSSGLRRKIFLCESYFGYEQEMIDFLNSGLDGEEPN